MGLFAGRGRDKAFAIRREGTRGGDISYRLRDSRRWHKI